MIGFQRVKVHDRLTPRRAGVGWAVEAGFVPGDLLSKGCRRRPLEMLSKAARRLEVPAELKTLLREAPAEVEWMPEGVAT